MKKISVLILLCLLALTACAPKTEPAEQAEDKPVQSDAADGDETELESESERKTASSFTEASFTAEDGTVLRYYLYTPAGATDNMPLVVYLHGSSQKATTKSGDLTQLLDRKGLPLYVYGGTLAPAAYMIFPQLPKEYGGWTAAKELLFGAIDDLVKTKNINASKVSLTGHSMGGGATWNIALASPDRFYKIAPLSGTIDTNDETLATLANKPVWAVVSNADKKVDPQTSIDFIAELSKTNPDAHITVLDGLSHTDVVTVYLDKEIDLISWLID